MTCNKEVIQNKMIRYGASRYGRSCANCVYREVNPARGSVCVLCDEPTKLDKCCGQWGGENVPDPVEEKQGELF